MTDLEITKACADAMGLELRCGGCGWPLKATVDEGCVIGNCSMRPIPELGGMDKPRLERDVVYDPLHDDAQAMALVKKFRLTIEPFTDGEWQASRGGHFSECFDNADLNRAICECVAKTQKRNDA